MKTKQTIAIIGATGNMGTALAHRLAAGNYRILLKSELNGNADALKTAIRNRMPEADIEIATCSNEACWEADIIIPAVAYAAQHLVAEKIREVANQKIVLSIANKYDEINTRSLTPEANSAAEELQQLLPYTKVVSAFNTVSAQTFFSTEHKAQRPDVFLAGNDREALGEVAELTEIAGFNPLIAGDLKYSRILEQMHQLLLQLDRQYDFRQTASWKLVHH